MKTRLSHLGLALIAALAFAGLAGSAQDAAPAPDASNAEVKSDPVWPRVIEDGGLTLTIYQPQVDKFDDATLEARAAVQVETPVGDKKQTSYGVLWIVAHTTIDKENSLVQLDDIQISKANFPTAGDKTEQYLDIVRRNTEPNRTISLDRIEANLAVTQADKKGSAVPLKNDPPTIYSRSSPAILIIIDGDPVLRPVEGSSLQRVINTRSLILQDGGAYFMPLGGGWVQGGSVKGPWQLSAGVSAAVQAVKDSIVKDENQSDVDLMEDPGEDIQGLLAKGSIPEIIVSTEPAELIVTQGTPQMKPIAGTQLLYVSNTTGDILLDLNDQNYYVPLTGRWFRAKSLNGPWQFVAGDKLPKDFAKIPENDPKSDVLATVPGTPAAQEAVIANSIPQTAEVNRDEAKFESKYDGEPRFDDVPDTSLQYAPNSSTPIIRVDASSYYAVTGGVWFAGASPLGPWIVATAVPPVIYTIPTACPIHYVTYVRIYRYDPTSVWVGYTPGYMGTCYSPWGTVVFGTGWRYRPWIGTTWIGAPMTWGFGAGISWNQWSGWNVGFGWGGYRPIYRPWWGPYYGWHGHPGGWHGRPGGWNRPGNIHINNINVYNRPGIARPGVRPIARPGRPTTIPGRPNPGARPGTRPAPDASGRATTRPVPSRPDIYAGTDGNVYRPRPNGRWETNQGGAWKPVAPSRPETRPAPSRPAPQPEARPAPQPSRPSIDRGTLNQLSRDQRGRQMGDMRMSPPPSRSAPPRQSSAPSRPAPQPRRP